jgi:hypothetical protein
MEPYYMDDSTTDHLIAFVSEPECQRKGISLSGAFI